MREGEEKGEGGVGSEKEELQSYPRPPAVYIGTFYYPEYPASGPEYPDSPEYPGPERRLRLPLRLSKKMFKRP